MQWHLAGGTRVLEALGFVICVNVEIPDAPILSNVRNQRLADFLQSRARKREKPRHPPPCALFGTSQTEQKRRVFLAERKAAASARLFFRCDFNACGWVCR